MYFYAFTMICLLGVVLTSVEGYYFAAILFGIAALGGLGAIAIEAFWK
jgi:hypothetical protein